MENGQYTFYAIQWRTRAKGGWLKPNSPLKPVPRKPDDWSCCGDDYWGRSMNPRVGHGNDRHPRNRKANDQWFKCHTCTGQHGWTSLPFALAALKRVFKDDNGGMYNNFDTYCKLEQEVRHEFRIIKITLTYQRTEEPLTVADVVSAA